MRSRGFVVQQLVAEAQSMRREAEDEVNALLLSAYHQAFQPKEYWKVAKVRDFCKNPQYGYTQSAKSEPVGPKFLRITDIQDGKVDWEIGASQTRLRLMN